MTQITVERKDGMNREEAGELDVPLSPVEVVSAKAEHTATHSSNALFRGTFPAGSKKPRVPDHLVFPLFGRLSRPLSRVAFMSEPNGSAVLSAAVFLARSWRAASGDLRS